MSSGPWPAPRRRRVVASLTVGESVAPLTVGPPAFDSFRDSFPCEPVTPSELDELDELDEMGDLEPGPELPRGVASLLGRKTKTIWEAPNVPTE